MKHLKPYKIYESENKLEIHYGASVIEECNSVIADIKDMLLELDDIGLMTTLGYTPMTLAGAEIGPSYWMTSQEKKPKIWAEISIKSAGKWKTNDGRFLKGDTDYTSEVMETTERIKEYVKSKGYVYDDAIWETNGRMVYQILIQKK